MFKKLLTYSIISLVGMMGFFGRYDNYIIDGENHSVFAEVLKNPDGSIIKDATGYMGESAKTSDPQNAEMQKMLNGLVAGLNIALDIITILVSPAIMLASWLMSPDWTSGDLFGIRKVLHDLWVTVSNIVYFIYAILLIFIALATIFNSQNYGYKQLLPKLALGVILVPMTWWFVQFTISLSTYITASVISIPMETLSKYEKEESFWTTESIPKNIVYKNSKSYVDDIEVGSGTTICDKATRKTRCISPKAFTATAGGMYSPLLIYSFSVFKFQNVKFLASGTDTVKAIFNIIHQGIIGALMFIVYGLLVLALVFLLFMRAIKLWFYAIFSPLFTIKYVLGDKGFGEADKDGSFKITEFIGLAFVPAVISLALSFGLVIISVMHSGGTNSGSASTNSSCTTGNNPECTLKIMGTSSIVSGIKGEGNDKKSVTTINIGGDKEDNKISYKFEGSVTGGDPVLGTVTSALGSTGNLFGTVILDIIALVFIWIAFMAGKGVSKAASAAIKPFEEMGNKIGGMAASLPKYAPLPLPGGSVAGMTKGIDIASQIPARHSEEKFKESGIGKLLNADKVVSTVDEAQMKQIISATNGSSDTAHLKEQGDLIGKQTGKEIEYSSMFKDVAENLKKYSTGLDRQNALKSMGYSDANAKIIDDKITKYGEFNKNDAEMLTAFKSRVGTAAGNAGTKSFESVVSNEKDKTITIGGTVYVADPKVNYNELVNKLSSALKGYSDVTTEGLKQKLGGRADAQKVAEAVFKEIEELKKSDKSNKEEKK